MSEESPLATRFCFEGDFYSPTASGRFVRELVLAARGLEVPISVQLRRSYMHQEDFPLPDFISRVAQRPPSGHIRVVCLPAFALPEKVEHGLFWALSGFDPVHPTPLEIKKMKAADRVWAISKQHETVAKAASIPAQKVTRLIPAVNSKIFHPRAPATEKFEKSKKFRFLVVGNPLYRKGIDLVLQAYLQEFKAKEPVELVIKLTHLPKLKKHFAYEISDLGKRLGAINNLFPAVKVISETWSDQELAGLMTSCQVLLVGNRAFQTALSVREAISCGLPVIGPSILKDILEIPENIWYPVGTAKVPLEPDRVFAGSPQTTGERVELAAMQKHMRDAFSNPAQAKRKGEDGAQFSNNWPDWKRNVLLLRDSFPSPVSGKKPQEKQPPKTRPLPRPAKPTKKLHRT